MHNLTRYGAAERHFKEAASEPEFFLGRVIAQYKELYKIITEEGEALAEVSGKFRYQARRLSDYPAVGDFVMADRGEDSAGYAVIHRLLPRSSAFERVAVGNEQQTQVVAANIDIVFICMSLNNDYNLSRLERYLSVAWSSGARPVVVLTKADLCAELPQLLAQISGTAPGVDVLATSAWEQESCDKLLAYLQPGLTASFIGSSGVGKSTLINRLAGAELMAVAAVRGDDKGRHTTTRRELVLLPQGGLIIDTPGMRELGVETVELDKTFADIDELAQSCRFSDCTHNAEPGCAVRAALQEGRLDIRRLESYKKLQREARYEGLSAKQLETEKLNTMFQSVGGMKNVRKYTRQNDKRKG